MPQNNTIINSLYKYFLSCPLLGDKKLNVDFLPEEETEYSIDSIPAAEVVKSYIDGSSIRQYLFVIRSVNSYGPDILMNIANSGFFESLSAWMEGQTKAGHFPELPNKKVPRKLYAQSSGYLFIAGPDVGKYQIQCRLEYFQEV